MFCVNNFITIYNLNSPSFQNGGFGGDFEIFKHLILNTVKLSKLFVAILLEYNMAADHIFKQSNLLQNLQGHITITETVYSYFIQVFSKIVGAIMFYIKLDH